MGKIEIGGNTTFFNLEVGEEKGRTFLSAEKKKKKKKKNPCSAQSAMAPFFIGARFLTGGASRLSRD